MSMINEAEDCFDDADRCLNSPHKNSNDQKKTTTTEKRANKNHNEGGQTRGVML